MELLNDVLNTQIGSDLITLITGDQAWHYRIIPFTEEQGVIGLYTDYDNINSNVEAEIELLLNRSVRLIGKPSDQISVALSRYYRKSEHSRSVIQRDGLSDEFVQKLVVEAKELGSSDIHIEIYDEKARIRMRIDGHLVERYRLEKNEYPAIINKLKIKASLDIAEKRLPQDGRIMFTSNEKKFDIRVSVLPTLHGEKVVLRLLSNDASNIRIDKLGFSDEELQIYLEGIKKPNGILLISGPTGSGKTTTLYATLKVLNDEKRNILTIEDPIEYTLEGINQVQLRESIGLTFSSALRTFLRQDPDVIMLGEIRDGETAQMAIRAALTGHLVLSTIHTNSAWGTVSRLLDMGIPSFLLSSTLNTTVAQRLVRLLCPNCKKESPYDHGLPPGYQPSRAFLKMHQPVGCSECHYTGYQKRKALYEIIPIDNDFSEAIRNGKMNVRDLMEEKQLQSLAMHAFELLEKGETSLEEVYPLLMNH